MSRTGLSTSKLSLVRPPPRPSILDEKTPVGSAFSNVASAIASLDDLEVELSHVQSVGRRTARPRAEDDPHARETLPPPHEPLSLEGMDANTTPLPPPTVRRPLPPQRETSRWPPEDDDEVDDRAERPSLDGLDAHPTPCPTDDVLPPRRPPSRKTAQWPPEGGEGYDAHVVARPRREASEVIATPKGRGRPKEGGFWLGLSDVRPGVSEPESTSDDAAECVIRVEDASLSAEERAAIEALEDEDPTTLDDVRDSFERGDHEGVIVHAQRILDQHPNHAAARRYLEGASELLKRSYLERFDDGRRVLRLAVKADDLAGLHLDHRAGFLLSLVDGVSTVDEILDVAPMPRLEVLRLLAHMLDERALLVAD